MTEFAITRATDWPMLLTIGSIAAFFLSCVVAVLVGVIWKTLPKKNDLDDIARRFSSDIEKLVARWEVSLEKVSNRHNSVLDAEIEKVWRAVTDCQKVCCPRQKSDKISP